MKKSFVTGNVFKKHWSANQIVGGRKYLYKPKIDHLIIDNKRRNKGCKIYINLMHTVIRVSVHAFMHVSM